MTRGAPDRRQKWFVLVVALSLKLQPDCEVLRGEKGRGLPLARKWDDSNTQSNFWENSPVSPASSKHHIEKIIPVTFTMRHQLDATQTRPNTLLNRESGLFWILCFSDLNAAWMLPGENLVWKSKRWGDWRCCFYFGSSSLLPVPKFF